MKFSVCMNTSREDYPMVNYPNLHIFEVLMRALRNQEFKDFEVVIADTRYNTRPNYFKEHPESFPVTHIPVKINVWIENQLCAISTTKNTCLRYVKGEYVTFIDDCGFVPIDYLRTLNELIADGSIVNSSHILFNRRVPPATIHFPASFYNGFGNITAPIKLLEEVNGYNELYDGNKGWEDEDLFKRVLLANNNKATLCHSPIIYYQHEKLSLDDPIYCPIYWRKYLLSKVIDQKISVANQGLTEQDKKELWNCDYKTCPKKNKIKGQVCPWKSFCIYDSKKAEVYSDQKSYRINKMYEDESLVFNLKEERENIAC